MIASKALGGCAVTGSYIESGRAISGVGNQSTGVVVIDVRRAGPTASSSTAPVAS